MDVNQTLVICLGKLMLALDRVLEGLDQSYKCLSTPAFHRLVAYELLASREMLDFNYIFLTQDGQTYMEKRQASSSVSTKKGFMVLRAPFLKVVTLLLENYTKEWRSPEYLRNLTQTIVSRYKQHHCCWYNVNKKKACPSEAMELDSQRSQGYVFCRKHWSPMLRKEEVEHGTMCPPSETALDEWLETIV